MNLQVLVRNYDRFWLLFLLLLLITSCSSGKYRKVRKHAKQILHNPSHQNHFVGLFVFDPASGDTLISYNSKRFFTPASNTKIFTAYAALRLIPDSIPALRYQISGDTLYFSGTGDPSLLHPLFQDSSVVRWMKKYDNLVWVPGIYEDGRYGPGWAWEDFPWAFSTERSSFPIFGNVLTVMTGDSLYTTPGYFRDSISADSSGVKARDEARNRFYVDPRFPDTVKIPIRMNRELTARLLQAEVGRPVALADSLPSNRTETLYGMDRDSIVKEMMVNSDNFLAEQIMIMASAMFSDTLSFRRARDTTLSILKIPEGQWPRWVDGSGLSRYNLFTPESIAFLLDRMFREFPQDQLFEIFPADGRPGTLEEWSDTRVAPYLYAKSGTLGNQYNLSGYLITNSGKILIFSYMNNNFQLPLSEVKRQMKRLLEGIREKY